MTAGTEKGRVWPRAGAGGAPLSGQMVRRTVGTPRKRQSSRPPLPQRPAGDSELGVPGPVVGAFVEVRRRAEGGHSCPAYSRGWRTRTRRVCGSL